MTIASEIERIKEAKEQIRQAVNGKWVYIPAALKLWAYPSYINQIKVTDYSKWTAAYWLWADVGLNWYRNWWLCTLYSEIDNDWNVNAIFWTNWWMGSSNCDYRDLAFLWKWVWTLPKWNLYSKRLTDNYSYDWYRVYRNITNSDCFLINRIYYSRTYWSWSNWYENNNYYRVWVNFKEQCMSCLMEWNRYTSWACCWGCDCDQNPPTSEYVYIWNSISCIKSYRWNRPEWILCTCLSSQDNNNYRWMAIFR